MIDWNNNGRIDPEEIIMTQFLLSEEEEEEEEDGFGEEREQPSKSDRRSGRFLF